MNGFMDTPTRRALLCIIGACAIAHIWCLGSQFYLDDLNQIRDSEHVRNMEIWETRLSAWTNIWYAVLAKIFGMSPVAFHALNWLLHTAIACVLFVSGRDYLRGSAPEGVALFGALLFAVHPLASEIPNYARTQDLAWVTLFSLLAAWLLFKAMHGAGWMPLLGSAVCIVGAIFSKGPGFMHALMMTSVIGLAFAKPVHWQFVRKYAWAGVLLAVIGYVGLWKLGMVGKVAHWMEPRVIGHAYTVCRVFWEFAWRAVLPIHLSADHHIAETLVPPGAVLGIADTTALWAALGMTAFTLVALVLAWRTSTRIIGICFFMFVGTMLMRLLYFIPEFMPEYRIYPGMPWLCLGCAVILTRAWRALFGDSGRIPALVFILVLAGMSAQRSFLYHNINDLMTDVLRQYPAQNRAVWIMQRNDIEAGLWQNVIDRHQTLVPQVTQAFHRSNWMLAPGRELPSGHFALAEVGCMGIYARAIAKQRSPMEGMLEIKRLETYMKALNLDPQAHSIHWGVFHHAKGLVLESAGDYQAAAEFLAMDGEPSDTRRIDLERVRKMLK